MPTAIVTGAASGIGLALTRHLLAQNWSVTLADVNEAQGKSLASELGPQALFVKTDVSSWEDQAALFKAAKAKFGRIDFVAANAGIDDKQSLYERIEGEPVKPNLKTIDVDLVGPIYSLWLAAHYFRQNPNGEGGKVVITSSNVGLYPFPTNPQYCTAKHGVSSVSMSPS